MAELNPDNSVKSRFVYGTKVNVPEFVETAGKRYRLISDHLGSPRVLAEEGSGQVSAWWKWDEWGNLLADSNSVVVPFGFAGGLHDFDTHQIKFGSRNYDSKVGRWIQKDPVKFFGGINLYCYVQSDPINYIDPSGLYSVSPLEIYDMFREVGLEDAKHAYDAANKAEASADAKFRGIHVDQGPKSSYRHCVWSCIMTRTIGSNDARKVGDIHEKHSSDADKASGESQNDKCDNELGIGLGLLDGDCESSCWNAVMIGDQTQDPFGETEPEFLWPSTETQM